MINWLQGAASRFINPQPLYGARPAVGLPQPGPSERTRTADLYRVLRAYYQSNGLYDFLRDLLRREGVWNEALKPLRNPSYRVVEFHAQHMWPGTLPDALPIVADNQRIVDPIEQVWKWSNWNSTKQVAARHQALYGDLFIKVAQTADHARVFLQTIEPEYVSDFDADERDFVTYARIDVPRSRRLADGTTQSYTYTEEWNKTTGNLRIWEHQFRPSQAIDELGDPLLVVPIEAMGIDFIPLVHAKFADIGEQRGMSALAPALDKIDEANREATRLAQLLFRNNTVFWALRANGNDASGRPLPPPRLNDSDGTTRDDGTLELGEDKLLRLPGTSELQSLVPNLNYEAALKVLQDHMQELSHDLPELLFYKLGDGADLSGRAVRLLLGGAIARLEEARGNAEAALIRADQMALTMGQNFGLFDLGGTFDDGALEHSFEQRDVLPTDDLERGQAALASGQALQALTAAGIPVELAVQEVYGWTPEQAEVFTTARLAAIEREQTMATEDVVEPEPATEEDTVTA